ncbi:MAG: 30S ribosomal protein S6 [Coriobacteriales bacterium]|jgi:small subunit ribosomal protein S6|nr:30S ribosomal protein S6 [Coriobacteriales bacterium]
MKAYELLYFVNPTIEDASREATSQRIETTITNQDGVIDKIDPWGKRKLAYEINKLTEGDYTLVEFHADPTSIAEITRVLRITDAIERFIIVRRPDVD